MTEHDTIAAALVAALAELTVIEKGHTADAGKYTYSYADLGDLVSVTRPKLAEHGIVALTPVHAYEDGLACTVTLLHTSGGRWEFDPLPFPHGKDAQATGSMITYHRRYALLSALGMATGDDDDGATAQARQEPLRAPIPGFRSSLMASVEGLTDAERVLLRAWLAEQGLPDRPSKMNAEQADKVCEYLMHGLPKIDDPEDK
jgi:hypothetical protein